jgi:hypothetical protein
MYSESVCQVALRCVDVGSLFGVVYFAVSSFREYLDKPSCVLPHMCTCMGPLRDCSLLQSVEIGRVAHPASGGFFPGVKAAEM